MRKMARMERGTELWEKGVRLFSSYSSTFFFSRIAGANNTGVSIRQKASDRHSNQLFKVYLVPWTWLGTLPALCIFSPPLPVLAFIVYFKHWSSLCWFAVSVSRRSCISWSYGCFGLLGDREGEFFSFYQSMLRRSINLDTAPAIRLGEWRDLLAGQWTPFLVDESTARQEMRTWEIHAIPHAHTSE